MPQRKNNQTIKCNVNNCKFNDDTDGLCTLKEIDVSCTCNKEECKNKKETISILISQGLINLVYNRIIPTDEGVHVLNKLILDIVS